MFSTILAYAGFVITSLIFVILILDAVIPKTALQRYAQQYQKLSFWRVLVLILIWSAASVYLWG